MPRRELSLWRGEITSTYEPDVFGVIQKVLSEVGYSSEGVAMDTFVHQQSPDIANAVRESKEKGKGCLTIKWIGFKVPGIRAS